MNGDNLQYLYWNTKQIIYIPIVEIISEVPTFKLIKTVLPGQVFSKWTNISLNCVSCQKTHDIRSHTSYDLLLHCM